MFSSPEAAIPRLRSKHDRVNPRRDYVGAASETLREEILNIYWTGVWNELNNILLALIRWKNEPLYHQPLPYETLDGIDLVRGYEPFLGNVCHDPRSSGRFMGLPKGEDAEDRLRDTWSTGLWRKRALMLLQSAQFLDVDHLFQYRRPSISILPWSLPFWKRISPPQMVLQISDHRSILTVQRCANSKCRRPIRGSSYRHIKDETDILCETCFRKPPNRNGYYQKHYKTCCLPPQIMRIGEICECYYPHNWPLDKVDQGSCQLFRLNEQIAAKKHEETSQTKFEFKFKDEPEVPVITELDKLHRPKRWTGAPEKLPNLNSEKGYWPEFDTSTGTSHSIEELPLYLQLLRSNYPFGNVHIVLRFGPLTFENGLDDSKGVTVSTRDLPKLQTSRHDTETVTSLELTERDLEREKKSRKSSWTRTVYLQERPRKDKRYKVMAKQIVGGAFCGLFDRETELDIAETLVEEAGDIAEGCEDEEYTQDPTGRLFAKVQSYLSSRVEEYVDRIEERLLDPRTTLQCSGKENSCQTFCDKLIDTKTFGSLFAPRNGTETSPLYLMSFVCRSNDYIAHGPGRTHGVPHGHVEEYLLKYRFGCHDDSDIMDTLQEYWHDWGNFEGVLFHYQDLFPWDCTQGFCEKPRHFCGRCNISQHVWAFPFDSFSLISLHLSRSRQFYPQGGKPTTPLEIQEDRGVMKDIEWFKNRLTLLMGQYSLLMGAAPMAKSAAVHRAVAWLGKDEHDDIDRIKLGGIVRAQPFSHRFEKEATGHRYNQYYVAGWTSLKLSDRIDQYKRLRAWRARQKGGLEGLKESLTKRKRRSQRRPGEDMKAGRGFNGEGFGRDYPSRYRSGGGGDNGDGDGGCGDGDGSGGGGHGDGGCWGGDGGGGFGGGDGGGG